MALILSAGHLPVCIGSYDATVPGVNCIVQTTLSTASKSAAVRLPPLISALSWGAAQ